jgi:hypothetical protein
MRWNSGRQRVDKRVAELDGCWLVYAARRYGSWIGNVLQQGDGLEALNLTRQRPIVRALIAQWLNPPGPSLVVRAGLCNVEKTPRSAIDTSNARVRWHYLMLPWPGPLPASHIAPGTALSRNDCPIMRVMSH